MNTLSYKTVSVNKATADKNWVLVDAENKVLGRFASKVAKILRGKYKTNFTPHVDCGDYVVVINADKIAMTGKKMESRKIFSHTGYPGGQKKLSPNQIMKKNKTALVKQAIKGMLPKNKLGRVILSNCYIYDGDQHPHDAQKPEVISLNNFK